MCLCWSGKAGWWWSHNAQRPRRGGAFGATFVRAYAETVVSVAMMLTKRPRWPLFWNFTTPETLA